LVSNLPFCVLATAAGQETTRAQLALDPGLDAVKAQDDVSSPIDRYFRRESRSVVCLEKQKSSVKPHGAEKTKIFVLSALTLCHAFRNLAELALPVGGPSLTRTHQLLPRSMIKPLAFTRSLSVLALSLLAAGTLHAQNYSEVGDAGSTVGGTQGTGNGGALTTITGSILSALDGDFFYINITNAGTFSATTVGNGNTLDTLLYLFTMDGNPVILNDDAPGGASAQSTLPAGSFTLAIGRYIIGISLSGAEPINSANQQLFADSVFSTDIRGPRAGALGPVTGVSGSAFPGAGTYTIQLTGVTSAIPEPSSVALLASAGIGGLVLLRRRSRR
jgi:hypothetical protein